MPKKRNIEDKIRESFEGGNRSAPKDLWGKLSDKLSTSPVDVDIDTKIKEGFQGMGGSAPGHVWDTVNRQINIDRVWKRISAELDRRPIYYWRRIAGIAALLLLLGGGFYFFNKQPIQNKNYADNKSRHQQSDQGKPLASGKNEAKNKVASTSNFPANYNLISENSQSETNNTNTSSKRLSPKNYAVHKQDEHIDSKSGKNNDAQKPFLEIADINANAVPIIPQDSLITMIPLKPILEVRRDEQDSLMIASIVIPIIEDDKEPEVGKQKPFEIGITCSYNQTWVLNNETRKSFDERSLIQLSPTYASSYGLIASYNLSKKSAISTEYYVNSQISQRYGVYIEGTFYDKDITLNYSKLTLLYQYNFLKPTSYKGVQSRHTIKAGIYGSYLRNLQRYHNGVIVSRSDKYTNTDYGFKVAIGQEKEYRRIILGYGVSGEYGLRNIFAGDDDMPADFDFTRNTLIGAFMNIKYRF